jgi:IclR family mhp operon transcriptional activator
MASFPPVRAVERAIGLLQCLNRQPVSTLDQLHRQTALPKPTLVRLLQTLAAQGLVRPAPQPGAYVLTSAVRTLSCGYHGEPRVIEAAAPVADAFTARHKWPVAVAVPDVDAVVVRYSTIDQSPLSLLHSSINLRLSLLSRALGRAYLAFCSTEEREALLRQVACSPQDEDRAAGEAAQLQAMLEETRARGYALRHPGVRPVSNTFAVPLYEHGRVVASMGVTWFSSTMPVSEAVATLGPPLREAAREVSARLDVLADRDAGAPQKPGPP